MVRIPPCLGFFRCRVHVLPSIYLGLLKKTLKENVNFGPKSLFTPLQNAIFSTMLKCHFYTGLKKPCYVCRTSSNYISWPFEKKKNLARKCQFLTKIVDKLPLQKCNSFSTLLKLNFYNLESLVLYVGHNQTIYIGLLKRKTNLGRKCSWKNSF